MGGYGSGGHNHRGRPVVESCLPLDMSLLLRDDFNKVGTLGTLSFGNSKVTLETVFEDCIKISWRLKGDPAVYHEMVGFQWLAHPRTFGGHQHYLICPKCYECRNKVYYYNNSFGCRDCHRLQYASQRLAPIWRLRRKLEKLSPKLGFTFEWGIDAPFLELKPKGMKMARYNLLAKRYRDAAREMYHLAGIVDLRLLSRASFLK